MNKVDWGCRMIGLIATETGCQWMNGTGWLGSSWSGTKGH